jgi:hypothetical protein
MAPSILCFHTVLGLIYKTARAEKLMRMLFVAYRENQPHRKRNHMSTLEELRAVRETAARAALKNAIEAPDAEGEAESFVSHHLEELEPDYWVRYAGTATPEPSQVIGLLELRGVWGPDGGDALETFDFTLPGDVTNYVLCVRFGGEGEVVDISMES